MKWNMSLKNLLRIFHIWQLRTAYLFFAILPTCEMTSEEEIDDEERDKKQQNEKAIRTQKFTQIVTGTERDKKQQNEKGIMTQKYTQMVTNI